MPAPQPHATIRAGVPSINKSLYHQIRYTCHDPAILIELPEPGRPKPKRILILRDVELSEARKPAGARADEIHKYQDFVPASGLSGERETATAQCAAEALNRLKVTRVTADRTLPLLYAHYIEQAGIEIVCDPALGQLDRRRKDAQEIEHLARIQKTTEEAIRLACEIIARAPVGRGGVLLDSTLGANSSTPLTSERVKALIRNFLSERNCRDTGSIVAGGPQGSDCHAHGHGELRTLEPVIIDVFPQDLETLYHGDCTRMVVNTRGNSGGSGASGSNAIPPEVAKMHSAVADAKAAAIAAIRAGTTGDAVHKAATNVITSRGYGLGFEPITTVGGMPHGTGHGIGLDLKEPPLLDTNGPELLDGDAVTVEPGIYKADVGGMRIEDLLIVTESGSRNLNTLHEGLIWG